MLTGQLATADSRLGNIVLGYGSSRVPPVPRPSAFTGELGIGLSVLSNIVLGYGSQQAPGLAPWNVPRLVFRATLDPATVFDARMTWWVMRP
jgi:hypothetical protein